jgi:membrane fusion protein, heavy metal efflux system
MRTTIGFARCRLALAGSVMFAMMMISGAHAAPGAHGPGGEHLDGPTNVGATGLSRLPDGSVNVPKQAQRRMGILTRLVRETEAAATAELPGRVVTDPNASGLVPALHGGRVEPGPKGLPVAGQKVRRGDVLAYVRHHAEPYALANQTAQLTELRASLALAEQRVQRLETLEGTVPRKDIEAARAELASLRQRERAIAASLGARETLIAPASGVIARTNAIAGQVVSSGEVLFEVVDPARMLVEATTVDPGLAARIGGAHLEGISGVTLSLIGASRSLRDGVLPLTFRAHPGKSGAALPLAIGQPVTVIASLSERIRGIVLPAQAIVRNPVNEPVVWIKLGAERYLPLPVRYQPLDAETVVVTAGLAPDNRVVVQGAPLIAQIR